MEKIAYLLWRDPAVTAADWSHDLRHGATAELLDARARGVQVNVADDAVADATLRFRLIDPQVEAVVGVWVDSARAAARRPVDAALLAATGTTRLEAYPVTESEPLPNAAHPVSPGERAPGFANLAFLRRPSDMRPDDSIAAWHDDHARRRRDAVDVRVRPERGGPPADPRRTGDRRHRRGAVPRHRLTDLHAFFAAPDDDELARRMARMAESTARFGADRALDLVPTGRYVMRSPCSG